jgi:hypothetical protein
MKRTFLVLATLVAAAWASTASAQQVSLTLRDGRVSLRTENASLQQILAEWERQGRVRIVGADRLAATQPLTLTLEDVSERQALDVVLRGVPGYMVVDRAEPVAGTSRYDRLVLMAKTTTPVLASGAGTGAAPTAQHQAPALDQRNAGQAPDRLDPDREDSDGEDANSQPPMPAAPVVNPYPGGGSGGGSNVLSSGTNQNVQPETQFDYANPQRYFERMRQMQMQGGQQGGQQAPAQQGTNQLPPAQQDTGGVFPGTAPTPAVTPTTTPTSTPSATGTLPRPGIAPPPAAQQPPQQQSFNPYNLPPDQLQGNPSATPTTTPVEPDRSKYANPYAPAPTTKPPQ